MKTQDAPSVKRHFRTRRQCYVTLIGVKHKFINTVLASNGYGKLPLGVVESTAANIRIKTEKQTVVGVANNLRNKSSIQAQASREVRYS